MAAVSTRCPRCRKFRTLQVTPIRCSGLTGQRVGFLCWECAADTAKLDPKPLKVVEK